MNTRYRPMLAALALCTTALALAGCCSGKEKGKLDTVGANTAVGDHDALPEVIACGGWTNDDSLKTVYFDFDSASLTAPTTTTLGYNAERILDVPNTIVQIAGHCDERGTQEYNLALGEKRAQSVRNHLRQLGVPGDRLVTISFGEESPAVAGSGEAAWAQNRRCEFLRAVAN